MIRHSALPTTSPTDEGATMTTTHTCDLGPGHPILATNQGTCPACAADEMLAHRSARTLGLPSTCQDGEPIAIDTPPHLQFHHQSYAGGLVKCRTCQRFTTCWSNHLRGHHIGATTVIAADHLRDVARLVAVDQTYGLDAVDRVMDAMDACARLGVDDASEGLATLAVDVMLAQVTGSRITATLHRLADEMAPLAHIG